MVPNIKKGASFRGAMLYYLHDKRGEGELLRLSDERVAWTATRNCAHDEPELAFAEMIATAESHEQLKQAAGERLSGHPLEQPVMTISLSWHPSEKPDRAEIERAADSYLKHMGLDEHQAVYLAHNDTEHAHVHIIVNRVHPERGKVHDDAFSKNRSQIWAAEYEREQGRIWCQERVGKDYSKANDGLPRGLPNREAIDAREQARHYFAGAWQLHADRDVLRGAAEKLIAEARRTLRDEQRATTRERQDAACKVLYDERAVAYSQIKQRQKEERAELSDLQSAREEHHPYDKERLIELVERAPTEPRPNDAERRADHEIVAQSARESPEVRERLEPVPAGPEHAAADNVRDGPCEKQPRRDLADAIAGGIAKAAEIVGNIMEGFLSPETPQEKVAREALARVLAETAPEREAAEIQRELDNRQAAYQQQKNAQEKFDEYFARHGARLRREEDERQKKDKDRGR
jgi:relaxase-like protein